MKTFCIALLFHLGIIAQNPETSILDNLKQFNNSTEVVQVGTFKLQSDSISIYDLAHNEFNKFQTDSVDIYIREGFIRNITVYMQGGFLFENNIPISLIKFDSRFRDKLFNKHSKDHLKGKYYILLGTVVSYLRNDKITRAVEHASIRLKSKPTSKDTIILQTEFLKKHGVSTVDSLNASQLATFNSIPNALSTYTIKDSDALEKLIDFRVYSDFLGIINESSNGIVNFEAMVKIPFFNSNIRNSNGYILKHIAPEIRYSRFDNKDRILEITEQDGLNVLTSKIEMLQKSFLHAGITLELFKYIPKNSFLEFSIPAFISFNLAENFINPESNGSDPSVEDLAKENLSFLNYGGGLVITVNRSNNFKFDFGCNISFVKHLQKEGNTLDKIPIYVAYNPFAEISFLRKNQANQGWFLRFNYTEEESSSRNFFQFQIGFKTGLNL